MRFLTDENFDNDILRALKKQNPDLDTVRVQDTEVFRADDPTVLEWAAKHDCILLTHDVRTMPKYAYERITAGFSMPGIIEVRREMPIKQAIDELLILIGAGTPSDFENQVRYVPMH